MFLYGKYLIAVAVLAVLAAGGILLKKQEVISFELPSAASSTADLSPNLARSGGQPTTSQPQANVQPVNSNEDIGNQPKLQNPPDVVKAAYSTAWSAGSKSKTDYFINLIKDSELNAIVIDIKDFSGHVLYDVNNEKVRQYGAKEVRIPRINALIKELHDENIYVIARLTVFQDPVLAKARPDLAIHNKATAGTWYDHKGLAWIDPAAKEAWDYNLDIARDALSRGFDEVNFDYIRFASDGNLANMSFPFYKSGAKRDVIKNFFKYTRESLGDEARLSADLFGLTTVNNDDLGIGQSIKDAALYFDYVAPMVYPSHFAAGFEGYKNPASYPYEVVKYSMEKAVAKLTGADLKPVKTATSTASTTLAAAALSVNYRAKLRPWLQDFSLGAVYDANKVKAQINAVNEIVGTTKLWSGWMLWSPSNVYTKGALGI